MPETKKNRLEMQKCLENIAEKEYRNTQEDVKLIYDPNFIKLWAIANQEVHPSGDQSLLSNQSIYSWERLVSMRNEAASLFNPKFDEVEKLLNEEITRRLLALLPQEK